MDVNKNFEFVTAFGTFKVSELMQQYVFEDCFPSIQKFLALRLPMKEKEKGLIRKMLKLMFMSVGYKSKAIHEKRIQQFVQEVRAIPQLQDLGGDVNLASLGITTDDQEEN